MLEDVKLALRIKTAAFDHEIQNLIDDCLAELGGLGVYRQENHMAAGVPDMQILSAVIFYCKWKFGNNPDAERWENIYRDKVTKLMVAAGYGLPARGEG